MTLTDNSDLFKTFDDSISQKQQRKVKRVGIIGYGHLG